MEVMANTTKANTVRFMRMTPPRPSSVQHDTIPNFVQNPTITTVRSGNWSDPRIWSAQRVPRYGDVIQISSGTTVEYSARSFTSYKAIGVNPGATLRFNTKVNTRMPVGTLIVFEGGSLQIGTPIYPVSHGVKAEILFDGIWLDKASDPSQYGVGLLGFGEVSVYGGYKSRTWLRLANEARAGDTYLTLETKPGGWQPGETLFLPDSRQIPAHMVNYIDNGLDGVFNPTWEEVTIDRVVGNRVYLRAPLAYNHRGATNENGVIEFLPHVAVLERSVVFRLAKPALARGHVMLAGRADVDIRYAQFTDLGRTDAMSPLDNTTRDEHGNVTHVGTNQIGRYSVHIHHLVGPENATNTGYQFRLIGNTIDNGLKWGVALHGSSYGLVQDNIAYKLQGSGFVTEDGSERRHRRLFTGHRGPLAEGLSRQGRYLRVRRRVPPHAVG
jgi:parallel beta-helix repeat protein